MNSAKEVSSTRVIQVRYQLTIFPSDALAKWTKDGKEIDLSGKNTKLTIDGKKQRLELMEVELSDAGIYACSVANSSSQAKLTVEEPKVQFVSKLPATMAAQVGTDVKITVDLSKPNTQVTWMK